MDHIAADTFSYFRSKTVEGENIYAGTEMMLFDDHAGKTNEETFDFDL